MLNRGSGRICEAYPYAPSGFKMLAHAPQTERLLSHMPSLCKSACWQQLWDCYLVLLKNRNIPKGCLESEWQGTLLCSCFSCNQWLVPWESSKANLLTFFYKLSIEQGGVCGFLSSLRCVSLLFFPSSTAQLHLVWRAWYFTFPFPLKAPETDLDLFLLQSKSFYWRNPLSDLNE